MKFILTALLLASVAMQHVDAQSPQPQEFVLVVGAGSPYETIGEVIKAARSMEAGLTCGASRGTPGCDHFARLTSTKVTVVRYLHSQAVVNDLAGEQLGLGLLTLAEAKAGTEAGKLRALAVSTGASSSPLPGVPLLTAAGAR
jgi:tripartite-type tricarboxylate transporter receptor subunit TctC